ncbi:acid phosphatase/Vanadium-dependent haloperoxidase [Rhypophila decipiens]|uniref:Acid phosphatase/Vanadium-dependent haloperoxidase n=1 Tax=Rhypophila decipiens TaxID=261697 RepID=A0AAN6XUT5_9PEZI|nr:acid phosphatase/Vanadium-dependent haloperoxidase [Rhypophila decipiens]
MKFSRLAAVLTAGATAVNAAFPGDIVQYWVDQSGALVNNTIIGGLQSAPSSWYTAIVQGAVYQAAVSSKRESLAFQQLAVSHAAHNAILFVFHGTRNYGNTDAALRAVIPQIGLDPSSREGKRATEIGRAAARKVAEARADDGIHDFVDYTFGPKNPGVYQSTPGGAAYPDNPQARFVRLFAGLGDVTRFRLPAPPKTNSKQYEQDVLYVKAQGALGSTVRTPFDTETAYFWRESSISGWNRFAHSVVGNKLATKVVESAKFYAQLNYALANAGIASWDNKFLHSGWRPVTAIQYPGVYLQSGQSVTDPAWTPLLRPTPSHPDYPSTHSTYGGAAAAVIRAFNRGSDVISATLSSNVTIDNVGVITRSYTNLTVAVLENSASRVFGGIHFRFAGSAGIELGDKVARATLKVFDDNWDDF